jgi:hypothetical protein
MLFRILDPQRFGMTIIRLTEHGSTNTDTSRTGCTANFSHRSELTQSTLCFFLFDHAYFSLCRNARGAQPAAAGAGTKRRPGGIPNSPQCPTADPSRRPTRGAVDGAVLLQHVALAHHGESVPSAPGRRIHYLAGGGFKNPNHSF